MIVETMFGCKLAFPGPTVVTILFSMVVWGPEYLNFVFYGSLVAL